MLKNVILAISIFLVTWTDVLAADSIGTVVAIKGKVYGQNENAKKILLQKGDEVFLKEPIVTQNNSEVQLKLKNNTLISLKSNTKYYVSEFYLDNTNPIKNRYVGNLVYGVIISMSEKTKNNAHRNHVLKTPAINVTAQDTLYEAGIKFNQAKNAKGVGWVHVAEGSIKITGPNISMGINSSDPNNSCVYSMSYVLDKNGNYIFMPNTKVIINQVGEKEMRRAIIPEQPLPKQIERLSPGDISGERAQKSTGSTVGFLPKPEATGVSGVAAIDAAAATAGMAGAGMAGAEMGSSTELVPLGGGAGSSTDAVTAPPATPPLAAGGG